MLLISTSSVISPDLPKGLKLSWEREKCFRRTGQERAVTAQHAKQLTTTTLTQKISPFVATHRGCRGQRNETPLGKGREGRRGNNTFYTKVGQKSLTLQITFLRQDAWGEWPEIFRSKCGERRKVILWRKRGEHYFFLILLGRLQHA